MRQIYEDLRDSLDKDFKEKLLWGSDEGLKVRLLPTGIGSIDQMLGGGFAHGRFALVTGRESAGKTLLALFAAKAAVEAGLPVIWIDAEHAWDPTWAEAIGLDPSSIMVSVPRTGEAAFNVAVAAVRTPGAGLIVLDSLAALTPTAEVEDNKKGQQQGFVGTQARMINRGLRTVISENSEDWIFLAINQIRMKVGVMYGNPETLPGGMGQSFDATHIIRARRASWITEGNTKEGKRIGYNLRLVAEKSKLTEPFRECTVPFFFTGDFDEIAGELTIAIDLGIIAKKPGGYYEFGDLRVRGLAGLREKLDEVEGLREDIAAAVTATEVTF